MNNSDDKCLCFTLVLLTFRSRAKWHTRRNGGSEERKPHHDFRLNLIAIGMSSRLEQITKDGMEFPLHFGIGKLTIDGLPSPGCTELSNTLLDMLEW